MDHPEEEISQHTVSQPNRFLEAQPCLMRDYQSSPFKGTQKNRTRSSAKQHLTSCCSCRIILFKIPYINFDRKYCCIPCFSNILIFPSSYQICNSIGPSILDSGWTANEELQLLLALEKLGYGNWSDIQAELGSKKRAIDIQNHYFLCYANHAEPPFVSSNLNSQVPKFEKLIITHNSEQQSQFLNRTQKRNSTMNPHLQKITPKPRKIQNESYSYHKIIGYSEKRDQFQIQFNNQLQLLIAEMEFTQMDTQSIKQLKINILKLFSQNLQERNQIKDFAIRRRLLDLSELSQNEKKKKKEEKELIALMKPFARFASQEQIETLISGFMKQNSLRKQIIKLQEKNNLKHQKQPTQRQSSLASSVSTGLFENNSKQYLKKTKNDKQKDKLWFLGEKEMQICSRHKIDFIALTFIKETITSINAIEGKKNPEEYFHSIFRLNKEAIHEIYESIEDNHQKDNNSQLTYSQLNCFD